MSDYKTRLNEAIEKVFQELNALSVEDLRKEIDSHTDDDMTKALHYAWDYEAFN
jgi:hypothetical protein